MRVWGVLALAGLLVAGCFGEPEPVDSTGNGADEDPFTSVHTVIDPLGGVGEPSLGVAPDGTLYSNGHARDPGPADGHPSLGLRGAGLYRSNDDGATWTRVAAPLEPLPNLDPDLIVDADGTVWFSVIWVGCSSVAVSRDQGESWSTNHAACNTLVGDRQFVVPTGGGTAYLSSLQAISQQMVAKTTDYGGTWLPTSPIGTGSSQLTPNLGEGGGPIAGPGWGGGGFVNPATGTVFFTWTHWQGGTDPMAQNEWAPGYALTRDGGASWVVGTTDSFGGDALGDGLVTGAADQAGNVYLAWAETSEHGTIVGFTVSKDDGKTWSGPLRVDAGEGSRAFPTITAGAPGKVAIAYYAAPDPAHPQDVAGEWNVTLAWSEDALSNRPAFQQAQLSDGAVKQGPIWVEGLGGETEGTREFLDYFQARVLPDGRVGSVFNSLLHGDGLVTIYAATKDSILGGP